MPYTTDLTSGARHKEQDGVRRRSGASIAFGRSAIGLLLLALGIVAALPAAAGATQTARPLLTLDQAVQAALAGNFRIKAAVEDAKGAEQDRSRARAEMLTSAQLNYSYSSLGEQPFSSGSGQTIYTASDDVYHWDVTLIQPLFTGFALSANYDMSRLTVQIRELERQQVVLDVVRDVKSAYFNLLRSEKRIMVSDDAVDALRAHASDGEKFYRQGLIPFNDLLQSQVALADALQQRERARAGAQMALSRLNLLLSEPLDSATRIEDIDSPSPYEFEFESLLSDALLNRPVLQALRLGVQKLQHAARGVRSAYYPQVSLVGQYEQNGDDPAADANDYANAFNKSLSLQATWTFFEWGKTRAAVARSRHDRRALEQRIKELENGVRLEVQQAWLNLQVAEKNIHTAQKALIQARENWRITNLQYQQQVATSTEVLDARAFLTQADNNYYDALYGYMVARAEMERAVGRF